MTPDTHNAAVVLACLVRNSTTGGSDGMTDWHRAVERTTGSCNCLLQIMTMSVALHSLVNCTLLDVCLLCVGRLLFHLGDSHPLVLNASAEHNRNNKKSWPQSTSRSESTHWRSTDNSSSPAEQSRQRSSISHQLETQNATESESVRCHSDDVGIRAVQDAPRGRQALVQRQAVPDTEECRLQHQRH